MVNVNFVPAGWERLTVAAEVSHAFFLAHEDPKTSHVNVRYLPEDPSIAEVEGERLFPFSLLIGIPLLALGLVTGIIGLHKFWKEPFWITSEDGF